MLLIVDIRFAYSAQTYKFLEIGYSNFWNSFHPLNYVNIELPTPVCSNLIQDLALLKFDPSWVILMIILEIHDCT